MVAAPLPRTDFDARRPERRRRGAPHLVEASGDLAGMGRWELAAIPVGTRVRYTWQVIPNKAWMRWFAPLLAPVFSWNHHAVMLAGAVGMAHRLGVELIDYRRLKVTSGD